MTTVVVFAAAMLAAAASLLAASVWRDARRRLDHALAILDDPDQQPADWQRHDISFRHAAEHAAAVDDLMAVGYSRDTAIAEVAYRHRIQVASVLVALDRHERRAA